MGVVGYRGVEGARHSHSLCMRGGGGEEVLELVEEAELC